jgi:O-antigen/teichoic acid export membrane protein
MQHFFSGIIQAYSQFLLVNIIKFFNILIMNLGLLFLSYLKQELYVLSFYMLGVSIITFIIYMYIASKKINLLSIKPVFELDKVKEILNYSGATWLGYLGGVLFTQLDKIIVGKVSNTEIVGIYAAIISITSYISSIATVGLQPIIPKLSELWVSFESKKNEFISEYKLANQFNTFIVLFISIALLLFVKPLLTKIMDIDIELYSEAVFGFQLAIIIYAFNSLSVPGFYGLMAIKKTKHLGKWQIIGAFIALLLIYVLGKRYGLYGVIIGNVGLLITVIFNFIVSKTLSSNIFSWLIFIYKALILFCLTIIGIIFFNNIYIRVIITIVSLFTLTFWFFSENKNIWLKIKSIIIKEEPK